MSFPSPPSRSVAVWVLALVVAVPALAATPDESAAETERGHRGHEAGEGEGHGNHRHEGHAAHSFADVDRYAAHFESPERAAWQKPDQVVAALGLRPGQVVADVGSGTGYFARRFARVVGDRGAVFASDLEPSMGRWLRDRADEEKLGNIVPVIASLDDPRLPDGRADLIFICDTWHHIGDRVEYARRLRRDLAPGGRVAIVDFVPGELPVGPPPGEKLSAAEVKEEFRAAGYRLVASEDEMLPYQYLLVFEPAEPPPLKPARAPEGGVEREPGRP